MIIFILIVIICKMKIVLLYKYVYMYLNVFNVIVKEVFFCRFKEIMIMVCYIF